MKAWRVSEHGDAGVLKQVELPKPIPQMGEVTVQVEAVGLNHLDVWVRKGVPGHKFPLPLIPGCDITGTIHDLGPTPEQSRQSLKSLAQSGLRLGSPVIINPGISCGHCEACLGGFDPLCKHYGILGETRDGGCAEWITVPIANLIPRPENISAIQGAALPIAFLTAWTMLVRKAELQAGEVILIQAGGSGVSVAAIQIAKLMGATVITTVSSDEKAQKARQLGADFVINYKRTPLVAEVKKILSGLKAPKKGCEVVLDHVGVDTFSQSLKCLAWGGRLVTCGATSGSDLQIDLKAVFFKNISILGTTMGSKSDLMKVVALVADNKLKPVIDEVYPLEQLPLAYARLENRQAFGKVILTSKPSTGNL